MMHPSYSYVANANQLNGYGGLMSSWGNLSEDYVQAKDSKGNLYFVFNNGKIQFAFKPDGTTPSSTVVWRVGGGTVQGTTYEKVLAHLRGISATQRSQIDAMIGGGAISANSTTDGTGGVVSWLSDLFSKATTKEEKQQAQRNLEGAANQYGPGIISAVQTLLGNKGSSLASLQKLLAKKRAAYETTTNAKRKLQLKYEIEALESQIATMQMSAQQASAQLAMSTAPEKKKFPWWIPVATVGGIGLITVIALSARRRG